MRKKKLQSHSKEDDKMTPILKWLSSLSDNDLIEHMTFSFQIDKNGISHEYNLLVEMLRLQSPPPTPIHPRGVGFKLATGGCANDGRNEMERVNNNRFRRPRLFQLIEKQQTDNFDTSHGISSLPPEILALAKKQRRVAKGGYKATSEWQNFEVIARKFVAPWGQVLSLGPTNTMRKADEQIMMCTSIQSNCRYLRCIGNDRKIYCTFRKGKDWEDFEASCGGILRLLHIVSRGRAFREPPRKMQGNLFASWFSPITEWFSLPMFLASRFEVALWDSFQKSSVVDGYIYKQMSERKTIIQEAFSRFSPLHTTKLISSAIIHSVKSIISTEVDVGKLRDIIIHRLLENVMNQNDGLAFTFDLSEIHLIPIIFVSTVLDEFRIKVAQECESEISRIMEADLSRNETLDPSTALKCASMKKRKKKNKKRCRAKSTRSTLDSIDEKKVEKYASASTSVLNVPLPRDAYDEKKNQSTVFVLGVINDILDSVFYEVGIASPDDNLNDDGFLLNSDRSRAKKKGSCENTTYILRKRTSKSNPLTQPQSTDTDISNLNQSEEMYFDNQLTMKRNNTSSSQSIWHTQSRLSSCSPFSTYSVRYTGFFDLFTQPTNTVDQKSTCLESDVGFSRFDEDYFFDTNDNGSFFEDFFYNTPETQKNNFASSTAASLASSILDNDDSVSLNESSDDCDQVVTTDEFAINDVGSDAEKIEESQTQNLSYPFETSKEDLKEGIDFDLNTKNLESLKYNYDPNSCEPQVPHTFLSLADLGEMKRRVSLQNSTDVNDKNTGQSMSSSVGGKKRVASPEDTEISIDDDTFGKKKVPPCSARTVDFSVLSYKNAAMKSTSKARSVSSHDFIQSIKHLKSMSVKSSSRSFFTDIKGVVVDGGTFDIDFSARSESALNDHENSSHFNVIPKSVTNNNDNITVTRDGATTISSIPAPHEIDEIVCLKEERDSYRDMCLSMAAEISKLKNMIALEKINSNYPLPRDANPFGSECIPSFYFGNNQGATRKYVAMSDAGFNDLPTSEDVCGDGMQSSCTATDLIKLQRVPHVTNTGSRTQTQRPSDCSDNISTDYDNTTHSIPPPSHTIPYYKYSGSNHLHILQSRLSHEVECFVLTNTENLDNLERKRKLATERLNKLVTAIWPRAQVKSYGSQETGLRLPSSDLDFVLYLPEVHKKAPADAPGDLEGRNAINETSQKLLARKLKSESWIGKYSLHVYELSMSVMYYE
jgi:DNA polymerase sigma